MTYDSRLVRDSSLLGDTIRIWCTNNILVTYLIVKVLALGEDAPEWNQGNQWLLQLEKYQ